MKTSAHSFVIGTLLAPEEYKSLSPLGTAPVITHNDLVLAETSAIIEYILDLHPSETLRPSSESADRARHLFWFHAAQGSVMPLMLTDSIFRIILTRVPSILKIILRPVLKKASDGFIKLRMERLLQHAEKDLATSDWFGGGEFTCADILLSYPLESANARGYVSDEYPLTHSWLQRIYQRPAFQAAKEKDGRESMVLPL